MLEPAPLRCNRMIPRPTTAWACFTRSRDQMERALGISANGGGIRPDYPEALNNLGVLFVRGQEYAKAEEQFKTGIRVAPTFDQSYLNLARLYAMQNDKEKAREVLLDLLACNPRTRTQSRLWKCYNERLKRRFTPNKEQSQSPFNAICKSELRGATKALCDLYLVFACSVWPLVHAAETELQKAPQIFNEAEALSNNTASTRQRHAVIEELQQHPSSVEGYNLLGIIVSDQQDYSSAIASFQKALQTHPNSTKTHVNLGNVYLSQKQLGPAEKEFRTVLRLDPANRGWELQPRRPPDDEGLAGRGHSALRTRATDESRDPLQSRSRLLRTKRPADALRMATELSASTRRRPGAFFAGSVAGL